MEKNTTIDKSRRLYAATYKNRSESRQNTKISNMQGTKISNIELKNLKDFFYV